MADILTDTAMQDTSFQSITLRKKMKYFHRPALKAEGFTKRLKNEGESYTVWGHK